MKKITHLILIVAVALTLTACGGDPTGNIKDEGAEVIRTVKDGVLQYDTSVTVGGALDGYDYFKSTSWDTYETSQGRTVVEFNGVMDLDAYEGTRVIYVLSSDMIDEAKDQEVEITYEAKFSLSKSDDSFEVIYSGLHITGKDNGEDIAHDKPDDDMSGLESIYKNQPEPETKNILYLLGTSS